jgi:uncharacterized Fe-S center protein
MTDDELDALIVLSFFQISEDEEPTEVDIEILTEKDRAALDALGVDLVDRILASQGAKL